MDGAWGEDGEEDGEDEGNEVDGEDEEDKEEDDVRMRMTILREREGERLILLLT